MSIDALLVRVVSNFLKTPKYGFNGVFTDCTEDVVCTEYFAGSIAHFNKSKPIHEANIWHMFNKA